jgi:hypothetical protein
MHRIVPKGIMKALFRKGNVHTMPYLIVRHKVEDYERWKPVFDHDHGATRKLRGSKGGWIFRNAGTLTSSSYSSSGIVRRTPGGSPTPRT